MLGPVPSCMSIVFIHSSSPSIVSAAAASGFCAVQLSYSTLHPTPILRQQRAGGSEGSVAHWKTERKPMRKSP